MTAQTLAALPLALLIAAFGYVMTVVSLMWMWDNDTSRYYHVGTACAVTGVCGIGWAIWIVGRSVGLV
jgi:drug/metabolite transporter superfamily protein YnfA